MMQDWQKEQLKVATGVTDNTSGYTPEELEGIRKMHEEGRCMPPTATVAWLNDNPKIGQVLYTAPPQRQPLTFEQVEDCFPDGYSTEDNGILVSAQWLHDYARAIEAAHGIKE